MTDDHNNDDHDNWWNEPAPRAADQQPPADRADSDPRQDPPTQISPQGQPGGPAYPQGYPQGYSGSSLPHGYPQQAVPQQAVPQQAAPQQPTPSQPYPYPTAPQSYPAGYSTAPGYGPQPAPGYPPRPPRRNRTGLIVAVVLAVLVLAGAGTAAVVLTHPDSTDNSLNDSSPETTTLTTPYSTTTPDTPSSGSPSTTTATIPGFQGVAVPSRGIAYDVPSGWHVDAPTEIRGFDNNKGDRISGVGTTIDGQNYCPVSNRTISFLSRPQSADPATAATQVGKLVATLGYTDNTGFGNTSPVALTTQSGITGQVVETHGTWQPSSPDCNSRTFSIYTFAFPGPQNPLLVLTIAADRGVTGEVTPALARQIFTSIRKM